MQIYLFDPTEFRIHGQTKIQIALQALNIQTCHRSKVSTVLLVFPVSFQNFNTALADAFWFYAETQKPKIFWKQRCSGKLDDLWLFVSFIYLDNVVATLLKTWILHPNVLNTTVQPRFLSLWFSCRSSGSGSSRKQQMYSPERNVAGLSTVWWSRTCARQVLRWQPEKTSWDLEADWPDERRPVETNQTEREPSWLRTLQHAWEDRLESTMQFRGQLTHHAKTFFCVRMDYIWIPGLAVPTIEI